MYIKCLIQMTDDDYDDVDDDECTDLSPII